MGFGAPKAGVLSLGSPSFSMLVLNTNELEKYLVVARCTEMCFRMHRVPRIFPIAKTRRKSDLGFQARNLATTAVVVSSRIGF